MTLVFDGTPSSGGPRCLRGRRAALLPVFDGSTVVVSASPGAADKASLVVSVKPATWPGTLVGVPLVAAVSVVSSAALRAYNMLVSMRKVLEYVEITYAAWSTSTTSTSDSVTTSATTSGRTAACTLTTCFCLLTGWLWLAGELD